MKKENPGETIMAELYDKLSSEFYDYHAKRGDIKFFLDYALEAGGPVLELGCGTGRVLIPTARAGVDITGLDLSAEMLKLCRVKLENEPENVRPKAKLIQADMRSFDLQRRFSLATITYGPFNNLLTVQDQLGCLSCINRHLNDGGRLVFDVFFCKPEELLIRKDTPIVAGRPPFRMPDGRSVTWGLRFHDLDYQNQIIHEELSYDILYADGRRERLVYPAPLRFFFRFEVEHLLARAGFSVEAVYADFDKTPFGVKPPDELIFVARKGSK
ncbi:MAG: class I SAM-dependent methyltransferase [Dehalococcoidales bacterium]|jgi:SAM-dependent methyltransferase